MKAFKVYYSTGGKQASMIVLADDETNVEEALSKKDKDYRIGNICCGITITQGIPLTNVMVSDLSVTELMVLLNKQIPAEGG